jgi:phage tail sheath gpL-like
MSLPDNFISRIIGYSFFPAPGGGVPENLPQRIAVFGEGNTADQAGFDTAPFPFTTAKQVGDKYGYGSPLHQQARILRPQNSNVLGGVKTVVYPQIEEVAAAATVATLGVTGTATANAKHFLVVNGRKSLDGKPYSYSVVSGDTDAIVRQKIIDAISAVQGAPCTAVENATDIDFTSKWKGETSADLSIEIDVDGNSAGMVYAAVSVVAGTGVADIQTSLDLFGSVWNTIVTNPYGSEAATLAIYETFNGVPDKENPTGRYNATNFKPFICLTGLKLSTEAALIAITDAAARKDQVTHEFAQAPNSKAWECEAAANLAVTFASQWQEDPHSTNGGVSYRDMPISSDGDIGEMKDYLVRNELAQKGCSTVSLVNEKYKVEDPFTTYHPEGENPPAYRKSRSLNIHWNVEYQWRIIVETSIQGKTILKDGEASTVDNTIALKMVKQLVISHNKNLNLKALITDLEFADDSITVSLGSNPSRLDIKRGYKITETADVISTEAEVSFFVSQTI